jgi:hypothetical protein
MSKRIHSGSLGGGVLTMRAWGRLGGAPRISHAVLLAGSIGGWLAKDHPAPAVAGLSCLYVLLALLAGPGGKALGLPAFRADEAYSDTLRRWRKERRER